ncbi:hypothetical protein RV134_350260 [Roseovarius sp. EC-HK134]|nr:hypothetical protein RV134_350260 [Roseovarius sp. EC-HK134]VVT30064.1 hypothetical protein RV420_410182 [Roseovarius sp. EC-SD190]
MLNVARAKPRPIRIPFGNQFFKDLVHDPKIFGNESEIQPASPTDGRSGHSCGVPGLFVRPDTGSRSGHDHH